MRIFILFIIVLISKKVTSSVKIILQVEICSLYHVVFLYKFLKRNTFQGNQKRSLYTEGLSIHYTLVTVVCVTLILVVNDKENEICQCLYNDSF